MSTMRVIPFSAVLRLARGSDTIYYIANRDPVKLLHYTYNINIIGTKVHDAYTTSHNITIEIRTRREQRVCIVTKLDIIWRRSVPYVQASFVRREI